MKIIFTQGVSASGKTTWAEQYIKDNPNFININRDDIRWKLHTNGVADWGLYKFTKQREKDVTLEQNRRIEVAVDLGLDIIISNTNLNMRSMESIMNLPCLIGYTQEIIQFDIDLLEALSRDSKRDNPVGYKVITSQYEKYMEIRHGIDYHVLSEDKPKAFICDIDGTIADMKGVRSPFEWDKVSLDKPRVPIIHMVKGLIHEGYEPIFVSGRDSICMTDTSQWIRDNVGVEQFYLFMRPEGSFEKDTKVKKDIFNKYIDNQFSVEVVLDDRPTVSRMFRFELGLNVISVANPYLEF